MMTWFAWIPHRRREAHWLAFAVANARWER